jgi:hypothetical protein
LDQQAYAVPCLCASISHNPGIKSIGFAIQYTRHPYPNPVPRVSGSWDLSTRRISQFQGVTEQNEVIWKRMGISVIIRRCEMEGAEERTTAILRDAGKMTH